MKHEIKTLFLLLVLAFMILPRSFAQEFISSMDVDASINKDGAVSITETIKYDFGSAEKHGILRNIPYKKTNQDGKKYIMKIENISVVDENGEAYKFTKSTDGTYINIKIGDPNYTISGKHTYVIKYSVYGALTYFDTFAEFYWNAVGSEWKVPIMSSEVKLRFLGEFEEGRLDGRCFTGAPGANSQKCSVEVGDSYVSFRTGRVDPSENFTVVAKFPLDYAARLEPTEDKSPIIGKIIAAFFTIVGIVFYLILPLYLLIKFKIQNKKLKDAAKIVSAWFSPPKTPQGSQLTPVETVITANVTAGRKAIPATLVSLAQRGYMKIVQKNGKEFAFVKTEKEPDDILRDYEESLYNAIFSDGKDEVSTKDLPSNTKFGKVSLTIARDAGKYLKKEKVFEKNPTDVFTGYTVLAVFAIFFMNIFLALVAFIFGRKSAKRTYEGTQTYSEALSLKNFLVSQDPQFDFQAQEMIFFEKLLPYATAFGVEDVWIKRFKNLFNTNPEWYEGRDLTKLAVMNSVVSASTRIATSSRSTSGFSSGFSGGHSGGGGGGGGGGSW
ncbi:MAG: hypothetical protein KatS3mg101_0629 [Patescibacteria group bacterium]|nr:MAG: hypothetical protein KatS3mg101_0629 [Patescibacteria group bacterium]